MAKLALAGFVLWIALALGVRSWIQLRRTGHSGIVVRASMGLGARALVGGTMVVIGLCLVPVAIGAELLGRAPWWDTTRPVASAAAIAVYAIGLVGTFASQLAMRSSWRMGVDPTARTELVTDGPFRYVRNPIYTFAIVSAASLVLAVPNAVSVAAFALVAVGLDLHVRQVEEPHLIASHGERYLAWAGRTGRFVPVLGRLSRRN